MLMISPNGVRVSVSDEKGERLKAQGWKPVRVEATPEPAPAPKPRRTRQKKAVESEWPTPK